MSRGVEVRLEEVTRALDPVADALDFSGLAADLDAAWNSPNVTMRARQQLLRALVVDIIADVDEAVRDVILTIHWRGGQHSQLRVRKPKSGEHGCRTPDEALAVISSMAARWPDEHIAASLNRMGMRTGQGKTWTAHRVSSLRRVHGIRAYRSAEKDGEWLTMRDAAKLLGVTSHAIRRVVKAGILPLRRSCPTPHIKSAHATCKLKRSRPQSRERVARVARLQKTRFQCFQTLENEAHNESPVARPRSARSAALLKGKVRDAALPVGIHRLRRSWMGHRDRGVGSTKRRQAGPDHELRARVVTWPPLRLARLRCARIQ